jgi:hypothetical protein
VPVKRDIVRYLCLILRLFYDYHDELLYHVTR